MVFQTCYLVNNCTVVFSFLLHFLSVFLQRVPSYSTASSLKIDFLQARWITEHCLAHQELSFIYTYTCTYAYIWFIINIYNIILYILPLLGILLISCLFYYFLKKHRKEIMDITLPFHLFFRSKLERKAVPCYFTYEGS